MKTIISIIVFTLIGGLTVTAQQITKPTLTPSLPTPQQNALINEGIGYYDQKMYLEAIAKFREVLEQNKNCVTAIYELARTFYTSKNLDDALRVSLIGSRYESKLLPIFYGMIGNIVDDQGNPEKAVELYQEGIKILKDENGQNDHLSNLYFNLAVTYSRQKRYTEARQALKEAVNYNFSYASPNFLLALIFNGTKYKVPALLAAGRFISLENNTQRSKAAAQIITEILNGNAVREGDKTVIAINPNMATDEGDFAAMELVLSLGKAGADTLEKNKGMSDEEKFVGQMETFINIFLELADKKVKNTFVGKNYLPFFSDMKKNNHVEAFAYLVMQENGNPQAGQWVSKNGAKVFGFLNWAKNYQ